MSLSLKNRTEVHPSETRYDLLCSLHNSLLALLGSIIELEMCEKQCVKYYCFEKESRQDICMLEKRAPYYLLLTLILYHISLMLLLSSILYYMNTTVP